MERDNFQDGYSLLEVLIALSFLAVVMIPMNTLFLVSYEGGDNMVNFDQAFNLTQDLMEEITSRAYEDPTGGAGSFGTEEAGRSNFDDVDDYDNYGPNSPPKNILGNNMTDYAQFTRSVTVVNVEDVGAGNMPRGSLAAQADGSTSFKMVTVTVTWDGGRQSQSFERIVADY